MARAQGMTAAYLIFAAIVLAMVLAVIIPGVVIGTYGEEYALQRCINNGEDVCMEVIATVLRNVDNYCQPASTQVVLIQCVSPYSYCQPTSTCLNPV